LGDSLFLPRKKYRLPCQSFISLTSAFHLIPHCNNRAAFNNLAKRSVSKFFRRERK
jgi:hypothetical protein